MEKVSVIGTGLMGNTITLAIAWADVPVIIYGLNDNETENAKNYINKEIETLIKSQLINKDKAEQITESIEYSTDLKATAKKATFIIEAVPENLEIKLELFSKLESYCAKDTIFASNSSSLPPTKMAQNLQYPERVLGAHFWNPAHLVPLVEIIRGEKTTDRFIERAKKLIYTIQKDPILVNKDVVGFVGNRLQFAILREAQHLYETGVASIEDIDKAVQLSIGRRLGVTGPFLSADLGGLDVFKSISDYTFSDLSNQKKASRTIDELVTEGNLGKKTGKGYYDWNEKTGSEIKQKRQEELIHWLKKDMRSK